jgi:hypothetical protein
VRKLIEHRKRRPVDGLVEQPQQGLMAEVYTMWSSAR